MTLSTSTSRRALAAAELLVVSPAALFMTALVVRSLQPQASEPARAAQRIILWYAGRHWTLWVLLVAMPLAVLASGCATLLRDWRRDPELQHAAGATVAALRTHVATLLLAAATLAAAGILAVVAVHVLAD